MTTIGITYEKSLSFWMGMGMVLLFWKVGLLLLILLYDQPLLFLNLMFRDFKE